MQERTTAGPQAKAGRPSILHVDLETPRSSQGGRRSAKDRYGVSWQVVPTVLAEMLSDYDGAKSQRAMQAMLQIKKLDIAALRRAYAG